MEVLIIFIIIILHHVKVIANIHQPIAIVGDITKCVTQVIEDNFKEPGVLVFAASENDNTLISSVKLNLLRNIHAKLKYNVHILILNNNMAVTSESFIRNVKMSHLTQVKAKYYLILIKSYDEFNIMIDKIIVSQNWNPSARFIVLLYHFSQDNKKIMNIVEEILTYAYQYNIFKIVIVVPHMNINRGAIAYGWQPLDPPKYCGYFNETAHNRLLVKNTCECGKTKHNKDLLNFKVPSNMKGCVINVLALEKQPFVSESEDDPNIEKNLIDQMLMKFNIKPKYTILRGYRGERDINDTWDGALKNLSFKHGQILLGGIFPDYDVHEDFECSTTYLADSYTWVVPKAYPSPPWQALRIIFKKSVWYVVIVGFLISVLSWRILGQLSNDSAYNRSFKHCFLNAWITTMGFSNYAHPNKQSLRIFCAFFDLYCLIFLTAYQTKLIDVLKNPTFEYQIKTTEELVASGLKFGGSEELHDLFVNSSDPFDYYLGERWTDVDDLYKALIDVAVHRNFSVLCSRLELSHMSAVMSELSDEFGNNNFYAFDRNMFTVPLETVALKGFPFISEFSNVLESFRQNGINAGLRQQYAIFNRRRRARLTSSLLSQESNIKPLLLRHLQSGFLALILGFCSGTVIFAVEVIYHYFVLKTNFY